MNDSRVSVGFQAAVGTKATLLCAEGSPTRLLPASLHNSFGAPREVLARVPHQEHEMNWIRSIKVAWMQVSS